MFLKIDVSSFCCSQNETKVCDKLCHTTLEGQVTMYQDASHIWDTLQKIFISKNFSCPVRLFSTQNWGSRRHVPAQNREFSIRTIFLPLLE